MFLPGCRNGLRPQPNRAARRRRSAELEHLERRALFAVTPTGTVIMPTEGVSFSGTVASFTANDAGPFTASIDWGDGTTTAGTIAANGGGFDVRGAHTYADEGTEPISVTIVDSADSSTAAASSSANVAEGDSGSLNALTIAPTEGQAFSGAVATFTDNYAAQVAGDWTATIDWGDGTTTTGTVSGGSGTFTISGDHTYADEGTFTILASFADDAPSTLSATITSSATVAEGDSGTLNALTIAPTEGQAFSGAVATFTDNYAAQVAGDWTATIDWGDGTTTTGTVSGGSGAFTISGDHTYADEGTFTVLASFADDSPSTLSATITSTAQVTEGDAVATAPVPITPTEGQTFSGAVATFTDTYASQVAADWTAMIDWGDGTTTAGTITGGSGGFTISGAHTYVDEGAFTILASFADDSPGTLSATITSAAQVAEADAFTASPAPIVLTGSENASILGNVAIFSDPGYPNNVPSDLSATIDWGDGTTDAGTVTTAGDGNFTVGGSHTYAQDGVYTITTSINDDSPSTASATATATANIAEADWTLTSAVSNLAATEGAAVSGVVATLSDPGVDQAGNFAATIDWGDGTTTTGVVSGASGNYPISGSHTYVEEGSFAVQVSVVEASAAPAATISATATLTVADAPLSAASAAIAGAEGATIAAVVAHFTDGDPNGAAADFLATIDWGDGATSAGTIASNGSGGFNVSGAHAYAEDGAYAVKVTIADQGGATAVANSSANITEPAISATAVAVSGFERSPLAVPVATFQHGNEAEPAGKFAATIDWGDGTSSTGTVSQSGAVYTVSGTHVYLDEGAFPIKVRISDDSASATVATAATIAEELLSNGTVGTPNERFVQEVYRDLLHRAVDPSALLYWSNMLDQGQSRLQVVKNIIDVASRGELGGDVVTGIFEKYLGRAPDAAGLAYWVGVYQNTPIEQIESEIAATPEFFAEAGGTNAGFITRLFNLALGRNPEPAALAGFNAAFQTGVTRELAAETVFGSHEFHQDEIQGYYLSSSDGNDRFAATTPYLDDLDFLDRPADAGGLAAFTAELDHGGADQQIWAKMMASDEFYAKVAWLAQPLK